MTPDTRDGAAEEITLEIEQMVLEIRKGFSLGDVFGEFVKVADPIFAVLPVGEADRGHSGSLSGGTGLSRGWKKLAP